MVAAPEPGSTPDVGHRPPWWLIAVATIGCAAGFYFGTGIHAIAALTWLAPLPMLWLAPRVGTRAAAGLGFAAAAAGATNNLGWYLTSPHDARLWPAGLLIMLCFAVTFALAVWPYRALLRAGRPLAAALTLPAVWTVVLFAVGTFNPTGIMGTLASAQGDAPLSLQTTSVAGMWGLEFLLLFVPAAVAATFAPGVTVAARRRTATVTFVVLGLALGLGGWRLAGGPGTPERTVALVSYDDSGWGTRLDEPAGRKLVAAYEKEIAALPDGVDVVVLPEGEFSADAANLPDLVDPMRRLAHDHDLTIVVGTMYRADTKRYNNALVVPPEGEVVTYTKHHDAGPNVLGTEPAYLPGSGGRVGLEICADLNFVNPSRDYGRSGARLLLIPAADEHVNGWLHARAGVLQTTANGAAMVWAARNGTLTVSDGYGRVLAEAESGHGGGFSTLVTDVPEGPGSTMYTWLGDWIVWLSLVLAVGGVTVAITGRGPRRRRRQELSTGVGGADQDAP